MIENLNLLVKKGKLLRTPIASIQIFFFRATCVTDWINIFLILVFFLFRLDFCTSSSSPRRGRRKRGADSFPERQLVIEPTFCIAVIHLLKIKLGGLKCSNRKHQSIYLPFLFHPLQEKISSLGCKSCILSCPQSLDK